MFGGMLKRWDIFTIYGSAGFTSHKEMWLDKRKKVPLRFLSFHPWLHNHAGRRGPAGPTRIHLNTFPLQSTACSTRQYVTPDYYKLIGLLVPVEQWERFTLCYTTVSLIFLTQVENFQAPIQTGAPISDRTQSTPTRCQSTLCDNTTHLPQEGFSTPSSFNCSFNSFVFVQLGQQSTTGPASLPAEVLPLIWETSFCYISSALQRHVVHRPALWCLFETHDSRPTTPPHTHI